MKRLLPLCLAALTLLGCHSTVESSEYILYYLNKDYGNKPVNLFFTTYGYPDGVFEMDGGYRSYRWTSLQSNKPGYRAEGDNYMVTDNYRGNIARQYCELRIYTNKEDIVRSFAIAVDSNGKIGSSRCSELFSR